MCIRAYSTCIYIYSTYIHTVRNVHFHSYSYHTRHRFCGTKGKGHRQYRIEPKVVFCSYHHHTSYIQYTIYYNIIQFTMEEKPLSIGDIVSAAAKDALRGGAAGAVAMGANVGALMWMRTTVRLSNASLKTTTFEETNWYIQLKLFRSTTNIGTVRLFLQPLKRCTPMEVCRVSIEVFSRH